MPTLTLQPDATAGKDTVIASELPNNNSGAQTVFAVGESNAGVSAIRRTLISFDFSALPSNAIITLATVSLYCTADLSSNARTFRIYRMLRSWAEGTGINSASGDGATWNTYDGVNAWTSPGAFDPADCEQTDIGSRAFTATETLNTFKVFTLNVTTKAQLDNGYGWLIKADTELDDLYQFASSDNGTAANKPTVTITYTLPSALLLLQHRMVTAGYTYGR